MVTAPRTFWTDVDSLVASSTVVIDRARGSGHPRSPEHIYPLDYGYLDGTMSGDGQGIDVWLGASGDRRVTAVLATIDLLKLDIEIKLLLGCSPAEIADIQAFFVQLGMRFVLQIRT
jgi:inorganic pyrophosphatase